MMRTSLGIVGALLLASSADAAVTFTSTAFDPGVPKGQTVVDNFNAPIASGYTFSLKDGATIQNHSTGGYAAQPPGVTGNFAVVPTDAYAALKTAGFYLDSVSVYIGSVDAYNAIAFLDGNKVVATFSGSQLVSDPDGNQTSGATNRLFDFDLSGSDVNEIVFASAGNSFEFANIAAAVPEPSVWALMIAGLGGIGLMLRKSRKDASLAVEAV